MKPHTHADSRRQSLNDALFLRAKEGSTAFFAREFKTQISAIKKTNRATEDKNPLNPQWQQKVLLGGNERKYHYLLCANKNPFYGGSK